MSANPKYPNFCLNIGLNDWTLHSALEKNTRKRDFWSLGSAWKKTELARSSFIVMYFIAGKYFLTIMTKVCSQMTRLSRENFCLSWCLKTYVQWMMISQQLKKLRSRLDDNWEKERRLVGFDERDTHLTACHLSLSILPLVNTFGTSSIE